MEQSLSLVNGLLVCYSYSTLQQKTSLIEIVSFWSTDALIGGNKV
jgi:hypothetical protein